MSDHIEGLFVESVQHTAFRRRTTWKAKKKFIKQFMDIENKKYKTQNQLKLSKYKEKRELADYLDTLSKKV
jgi:hypothetical protein